LGPPILRLTHEQLNDSHFRQQVIDVLRYWIRVDRQTIARFHAGVSLIDANYTWRTNHLPTARQELLAIDGRPGANIEKLARALAPTVLGLGAHLQHQDNRDAFLLIPVLRWLQDNGYGTLIIPQLLDNLSRAEREGVSPRTYL
jgi:hypothetical protein